MGFCISAIKNQMPHHSFRKKKKHHIISSVQVQGMIISSEKNLKK